MEKRPTLEEVREYFKDAEKCKSTMGSKFKMSEYDLENAYFSKVNAIAVNKKNAPTDEAKHLCDLDSRKYAKILSYKKPKDFTITKEQILEIHKGSDDPAQIEEWFPFVFEEDKKELSVGKWYKGNHYKTEYIFCFTRETKENRKGYGFCLKTGVFSDELSFLKSHDYEFTEATAQEVEEMLKAECEKRYKVGDYVLSTNKELKNFINRINLKYNSQFNNLVSDYNSPTKTSVSLFRNGVWAEILETLTPQQAEEKLKELWVDVKII